MRRRRESVFKKLHAQSISGWGGIRTTEEISDETSVLTNDNAQSSALVTEDVSDCSDIDLATAWSSVSDAVKRQIIGLLKSGLKPS